jgi:AAA domain
MSQPFKVYSHADLIAIPQPRWLLEPHIREKALIVLYGEPGAYKTFQALDWALHIAQRHRVVYVAGEDSYAFGDRISAWCAYHGISAGNLHVIPEEPINLLECDDIEQLIFQLADEPPALMVFDTLSRLAPGLNENANADMSRVIANMGRLCQSLHCAVLVIHHTNAKGIRERGHTSLRGAASAMYAIRAHNGHVTVTTDKNRHGPSGQEYHRQAVTVLESIVLVDATKQPTTTKEAQKQSSISDGARKLLEIIIRNPNSNKSELGRLYYPGKGTRNYKPIDKLLYELDQQNLIVSMSNRNGAGYTYQAT